MSFNMRLELSISGELIYLCLWIDDKRMFSLMSKGCTFEEARDLTP